jgi:8-oxo-dGTP pyrophosphatase MutT (NUDIX family)
MITTNKQKMSTDDVILIESIVEKIENRDPKLCANHLAVRYASVSIIIRHLPNSPPEMLYLLRSSHENDRWSGHVAFPGGKRDPEDNNDSLTTAIRETREEVGIDLNSKAYRYLGRLNDLNIGYGIKMIVSPHGKCSCSFKTDKTVFLQVSQKEEPCKISEAEVQAVRYVSLAWLSEQLAKLAEHGVRLRSAEGKGVHGKDITMRMNKYIPPFKYLSNSLADQLNLITKFPNICLHEHSNLSTKLAHELDEDFVLWGLTLKMTVHFFEASGIFEYFSHQNTIDRSGLKQRLNGFSDNMLISLFLTSPLIGWYGESPLVTKLKATLKPAFALTLLFSIILLARILST